VKQNIKDLTESVLAPELSHLFVELTDENTRGTILAHLARQGLTITAEQTRKDDEGGIWLILSVALPDVSQIVWNLIESGLSVNVQGINAKR